MALSNKRENDEEERTVSKNDNELRALIIIDTPHGSQLYCAFTIRKDFLNRKIGNTTIAEIVDAGKEEIRAGFHEFVTTHVGRVSNGLRSLIMNKVRQDRNVYCQLEWLHNLSCPTFKKHSLEKCKDASSYTKERLNEFLESMDVQVLPFGDMAPVRIGYYNCISECNS